MLNHQRLDVYVVARKFVKLAFVIGNGLPRGEAELRSQLRLGRAAERRARDTTTTTFTRRVAWPRARRCRPRESKPATGEGKCQ